VSRSTAAPQAWEPRRPFAVDVAIVVVLGSVALVAWAIADLSTLVRRIARRLTR